MRFNLKKMTLSGVLIAVGFLLSPILRVPGMAPMQHFINVITAVFLGPWYALFGALAISFLRMVFMGINILAITGSVFGATLSGLLYRKYKHPLGAVLGEIIGTGIIGSLLSYPAMAFIVGNKEVALFTFVPSFIAGTIIGSSIAYLFLRTLIQNHLLDKIQRNLEG